MYNATEQFAEINKAGYDNAVKLASLSLDKAERLTKLNLQAAKVALEQGVYTANAVAGIKDVQELAAVRAKLTEAGVQNALGYSRGVYQIASEAQADFSALAEAGVGCLHQGCRGLGRKGDEECAGRLRRRRDGAEVDGRCDDRGVRSVLEGDQAGRQLRRRVDARRSATMRPMSTKAARQGSQGCVRQSDNASPLGA